MDLVHVSSAAQLYGVLPASLSPQTKHSIASTVLSLAEIQRAFDTHSSLSNFLPDHLVILPPPAQGVQAPGIDCLKYLHELATLANSAAESLACSSILAGQGSENDDTGDVALWLGKGDYGAGNERGVLEILGLTPWLEQGAGISRVSLSTYHSSLPSTLSDHAPSPEVQGLVNLLNAMADKYCFRVSSPSTAPLVVFLLLGRMENVEWAGLVGIGTWSDQ